MKPDSISVIMPAFNAAKYIREALDSVLAQSHRPAEVIVIDDGSTDATGSIAAEFESVRVIRQENRGIGGGRNTGVGFATGTFLAFLDADDLWPSTALEELVRKANTTDADVVFGKLIQFGDGLDESEPAMGYLAGSGLFRRTAYDRVGPFREDIKVGEFIDWWARAQEAGLKHTSIETTVLKRRIHRTNTGITEANSRVDYTRVLRAALERRRGQ